MLPIVRSLALCEAPFVFAPKVTKNVTVNLLKVNFYPCAFAYVVFLLYLCSRFQMSKPFWALWSTFFRFSQSAEKLDIVA